ncbi:hypothetical protein [Terriglobus saanensis]|uniref:hypothetical protein n=1 Tax=Terriglobus saanensis TaxID=870903 RepID=UPI001651367A|nr:hypothetical protein [Terriglobus saanensis]
MSAFRWQRTVHVPERAGVVCAVLDAEVFPKAEPALRDLRLVQDGEEVPYAVEESYDEESLRSGVTRPEDRSLYEVAAEGSVGAALHLPAKVPVERVAVEGGQGAVDVEAMAKPSLRESVRGELKNGVFPVTLGANLQKDAEVRIWAKEGRRVRLEMRRRSLCFTPLAGGTDPILYFGAEGLPAVQYGYARGFTLPTAVKMAHMGDVAANPAYRVNGVRDGLVWWKLMMAAVIATVFFVGMSGWMLRRAIP